MEFRWLIAITVYTLLIGPIMDVPSSNAKAKARLHDTNQVVAKR
jgi:hypothetical protein